MCMPSSPLRSISPEVFYLTEEEQLHLSPSRAVWVLLEDEGESGTSATALFKITVPQEKSLQRRK